MNMNRSLPPIALAVCLALAGCSNAKPGPSLDSDNASERLQAVRQTQNNWGATKVAAGIDQNAIVGRWNHPWGDSAYMRFNADGTFKWAGWLNSTEGTYRFPSNDVIELTFPGTFYGSNVMTMEYRLFRDTLELKIAGDWVKYKKAI
jgi:hypothetical protein